MDEPRRASYCHWVYDVAGNLVMRSHYRDIPERVIAELEARPPLPLNWREEMLAEWDAETEAIRKQVERERNNGRAQR